MTVRGLPLDDDLDPAEALEDAHHHKGREQRLGVMAAAERDADRRDDPDRSRAGQPAGGPGGVEDGPRADEPPAGHDLAGPPGGVRAAGDEGGGELGIEGRPHADKDVGAQARRLATQFALEADRPAEKSREPELEQQLEPEDFDHLVHELWHQASAGRSPIRRRTSAIVCRANARALAAPARRTSRTRRGSARRAAARSRMGVRAAIILSASTRLQSRHPHPAVRHLCATSACTAGAENPWWIVKTLQMSGLPGSLRVFRAGSVAAGRSFSQIESGGSNRPIVFPRLLDILACPSSPSTRRAVESCAWGSGKKSAPKRAFH